QDANGCKTIAINDNYNCNCGIIDAGKLDTTPTILCENECVSIKNLLSEQIDPTEDAIIYVLHTGFYKNAIDTFYSQNDQICFNKATMLFGLNNIYYISRIVGDDKSPKDGIVDSKDPCLRVSNNQPVIWLSKPEPKITGPLTIDCKNSSIFLDGSNSIVGSGTNAQYKWSTINGRFVNPNLFDKNRIEIDKPGTYELEITDPIANCKNKTQWIITADFTKPIVLIDKPKVLTCELSNVQILGNRSSTGTNYSARWSGPGIVGASNGYQINAMMAGTYFLHLINNDNGCEDSASIVVLEDKALPKSIIKSLGNLICATAQIQLDGSSSKGASGKISSYVWTSIQGQIQSGQGSPIVTIGKPGGIYILTVKDAINGCLHSDTITTLESANPLREVVLKALDPTCFGEKDGEIEIIEVLDSLNQTVGNIEYSFNGGPFGNASIFKQKSDGIYNIIARDKKNGCLINKQVILIEPKKLSISVLKEKIVNQGDIVYLDSMLLSLFGGTTKNGFYKDTLWFNTDDQIDWEPYLKYEADKTRDFVITGIDQSDCEVLGQVRIVVRIVRNIWWPSVFSPNQDGQNDYFNLYGKHIKNIKLLNIFDRWGNQVYSNSNLQASNPNQGWDGNFRGIRALPGVYTFLANVEYEDSNFTETVAGN
ncbi:MAG: gliding motility-associated C-terminal domain-containing protein, partial [Saprospiraceae bacterium]